MVLGTLVAADAGAESDSAVPVVVTLLGPSSVRVRVSEGRAMPCNASESRLLIDGKFDPGEVLRAASIDDCVCVQQTYEPFTESDWSEPRLVCRAMNCEKLKSDWRCKPAPDPTIRIDVASKRPE